MDEEVYDMYGKNGCELDQQHLEMLARLNERFYTEDDE